MRTIEDHKSNIIEFCTRFHLEFKEEGEVGFGRKCVGILHGDNYVDYNPMKHPDYEYIAEFKDERLYDIAPEDAYHKHNCIAVLGSGDEAIVQLSEWVDALNELGVTVERYSTGAEGIQAMITGYYGYAVKVLSE